MLVGDAGEDRLIALFAARGVNADAGLTVDNGDDAAAFVLPPGVHAVVTTDSLVQGVHFRLPNRFTGRKLAAVNLSDVAAMGAVPRYALLSAHLPAEMELDTAREIAVGLHEQLEAFDVAIIGGNVSRIDGPVVLAMTLIGAAARPLQRGTAKHGESLFVTGTLGDACAGLEVDGGPLWSAQFDPEPRVDAGRALASIATAMCDVSDGLARDLAHLLAGTGLGARVDSASLPISDALRAHADDAIEYAVTGGEDYELLFTSNDPAAVFEACRAANTPVARIGSITGEAFVLVDEAGRERPLFGGFDHFTS